MLKVPWAEPIERKLRPIQGVVMMSLIIIILITIYLVLKGSSTAKTGWLVWLMVP